MTTAANWGANGASLEDCHSNIFSLVQYHYILARHRHASQFARQVMRRWEARFTARLAYKGEPTAGVIR